MSLELTPSVGALQWLVTAVGIRPIIASFWERSSAPSRSAASHCRHLIGAAVRLTQTIAHLACGVLLASCVMQEREGLPSQIPQSSRTQIPSARIPAFSPSPSSTVDKEPPTPNPAPPTPPALLGITELRPGTYLGPHVVYAAFSADARLLYLAYASDTAQPRWVSIDVTTGEEQPLFPPPPVFRGHPWNAYQYPSLVALVSPHRRFQLLLSEDDTPTALLMDLTSGAPNRRLASDANFGTIVQAQWSTDESLVAFGIYTPDFGEDIFVTHTATGETHPLHDLIGYEDHCPHEWQLSPDSTKIAQVDCAGELRIFTLSGIEIVHRSGYFENIIWSADSRYLYYYAGAQYIVIETLNAFDTINSCEIVMLTQDDLAPLDRPGFWYRFWPFIPSPDRSQLLMWGRGLYLFRIRTEIYDNDCGR